LKELKTKLRLKSAELLVVLILFLFSLRVLNWFEYPYIVIGGDLKPPLVREAFIKRVMYSWDETDLGMPSVYPPRILDPFYFFVTVFQALGVSLYLSQIVAVFLLYFFSSILMYIYVKQLTDGDLIAALVAALFLTANVHLVTDRELTAIGFMDTTLMILPCLATFTMGIKAKSYKLMTVSALFFVLTYGVFPNYAVTLLCFISLALTSLFMLIRNGSEVIHAKNEPLKKKFLNISLSVDRILEYVKLKAVFVLSLLSASIWVIAIFLENSGTFLAANEELGVYLWVLERISLGDVVRLIAKWGFYESGWGHPYVFYASRYLQNGDPLVIFLSYIPPILAFSSLLTFKSRKLTIFFSGIAVLSLFLTAGFKPYFSELYIALITNIPLMIAFREPMKWIFIVILSYSILIGIALSNLYHKLKRKAFQILALGLTILLFLSSSYPLTTGDVTRNWVRTEIKGGYFPPSYVELNDMLSDEYWAVLVPKKQIYLAYNFTQGNLTVGNPYPFIFSKPIISGVGTEYISAGSQDLVNKVHQLLQKNDTYENVALEGKASVSSIESVGFEPDKAIDGQFQTRWASSQGLPQWFEIEWNQTQKISKITISFEAAYAEDFSIQTWNGTDWAVQITVENNTERQRDFEKPVNATRLRIYFSKASSFGSVSMWELQVYARTEGVSKFLGMLGIKYLILEKNITFGNAYSVSDLKLDEKDFILHKEWEEIKLLENLNALQKVYVADEIRNYSTFDDIYELAKDLEWHILEGSVLVNATLPGQITNRAFTMPINFTWREISPTEYRAHVTSTGPFIFGFLENYDEHWKVYVNGKALPETSHLKKINGFANGWVIDSVGDLTITIEYEPQNILYISIVASITLPLLLLVLLNKKELKRIIHKVSRRALAVKLSK